MGKPRRANRDLVKAMNRNLILNMIRQYGPLSRTQLTEISRLSAGAVSQISNELCDENWVVSAGESASTGGRRPEMLRLNPTAGCVVGLKLMEDRLVCALTDLEGQVLTYTEAAMVYDHSVQTVSQKLAEIVRQTIQSAAMPWEKVLGVGIGLAGIIEHEYGLVHHSPYFHWRDVPLADLVAAQIDLPVYLENDVNTLTLAEQLFGIGRDIENFVLVTVGRGIGMGMILNHQLYQGLRGGVGELGHITVIPDGPACDCGKRGCLEAIAADPAVLRYVQNALQEGRSSTLTSEANFPEVIVAAEEGDSLAKEALAHSGAYLGLGISMIVNMLHPALIVISGEGVKAGEARLAPAFAALREHTFSGLLEGVEIITQEADDQTWARGAASLVLGKVFETPILTD
jgi:N-acetylglucosamine repressor